MRLSVEETAWRFPRKEWGEHTGHTLLSHVRRSPKERERAQRGIVGLKATSLSFRTDVLRGTAQFTAGSWREFEMSMTTTS